MILLKSLLTEELDFSKMSTDAINKYIREYFSEFNIAPHDGAIFYFRDLHLKLFIAADHAIDRNIVFSHLQVTAIRSKFISKEGLAKLKLLFPGNVYDHHHDEYHDISYEYLFENVILTESNLKKLKAFLKYYQKMLEKNTKK